MYMCIIPTVNNTIRFHTRVAATLIQAVAFLSLSTSGPDLSLAGPSRAHTAVATEPLSGPFHFQDESRFAPEHVLSTLASLCSLPLHRRIPPFRSCTPRANGDAGWRSLFTRAFYPIAKAEVGWIIIWIRSADSKDEILWVSLSAPPTVPRRFVDHAEANLIRRRHPRRYAELIHFVPFATKPQKLSNISSYYVPPTKGELKLNVDGSWSCASKQGAVAGICRDHHGCLVGGFAKKILAQSALVAETLALKEGLHFVEKMRTSFSTKCPSVQRTGETN